jgi:hypothetical protein
MSRLLAEGISLKALMSFWWIDSQILGTEMSTWGFSARRSAAKRPADE